MGRDKREIGTRMNKRGEGTEKKESKRRGEEGKEDI